MGIFRTLGSRSLSVTAMLKNVDLFQVKRIEQSTAQGVDGWHVPGTHSRKYREMIWAFGNSYIVNEEWVPYTSISVYHALEQENKN